MSGDSDVGGRGPRVLTLRYEVSGDVESVRTFLAGRATDEAEPVGAAPGESALRSLEEKAWARAREVQDLRTQLEQAREAQRRAEERGKLVDGLCQHLSQYAGESGESEGAEEVLVRLLGELRRYRTRLGVDLRNWVHGGEAGGPFNWTPEEMKRLLDDVRREREAVGFRQAVDRIRGKSHTASVPVELLREADEVRALHSHVDNARAEYLRELTDLRGEARQLRERAEAAEKEARFQKETREKHTEVHLQVEAEHEEDVMKLIRERDDSLAEVERLRAARSTVYTERNELAALVARMVRASCIGYAGTRQHDPADASWEPDWRTILMVDLPTGQVSWHLHDSERHLLAGLPEYPNAWDGHTTEQKRDRVRRAFADAASQSVSQVGASHPLPSPGEPS